MSGLERFHCNVNKTIGLDLYASYENILQYEIMVLCIFDRLELNLELPTNPTGATTSAEQVHVYISMS